MLTGDSSQAGVGDNTASQVHLEGLHTMIEQADPGDRQRYQVYQQISQPLMFMYVPPLDLACQHHTNHFQNRSLHGSSKKSRRRG